MFQWTTLNHLHEHQEGTAAFGRADIKRTPTNEYMCSVELAWMLDEPNVWAVKPSLADAKLFCDNCYSVALEILKNDDDELVGGTGGTH